MVKNLIKSLVALALLILIPTGTPDDLIVIPALLEKFGQQGYVLIVIIAAALLYFSIDGKTIQMKLAAIKKEVLDLF